MASCQPLISQLACQALDSKDGLSSLSTSLLRREPDHGGAVQLATEEECMLCYMLLLWKQPVRHGRGTSAGASWSDLPWMVLTTGCNTF